MTLKDLNDARKKVVPAGDSLKEALSLAMDFDVAPTAIAVIRGSSVTEVYRGVEVRDIAKGRLFASGYRPLSTNVVDGVMLVVMPPLTQGR